MIQAYEKIHMEKSNLQRDLDKMVRDITQSAAPRMRYLMGAIWLIHVFCRFHALKADGGRILSVKVNMADVMSMQCT